RRIGWSRWSPPVRTERRSRYSSRTAEPACPRNVWRKSSNRSSRENPTARAWGFRSAARSSSTMAADFGPLTIRKGESRSSSPCRLLQELRAMMSKPVVYVVDDERDVRDALSVTIELMDLEPRCYGRADEFLGDY